jgi:hypothetical protein
MVEKVATENFSIVIHDGRVIRFILLIKILIFYHFNFIVLNIVASVCGRFINLRKVFILNTVKPKLTTTFE